LFPSKIEQLLFFSLKHITGYNMAATLLRQEIRAINLNLSLPWSGLGLWRGKWNVPATERTLAKLQDNK
jgi:hypothetical protein